MDLRFLVPPVTNVFLILLICLCVLSIAAAIDCILLYIDRRHGLIIGTDKLSHKELQLMYLEYQLPEPYEHLDHAEHIASAYMNFKLVINFQI